MSKKIAIYLAGLALTLFIMTCGTEPPEPLWSGTPEDSTAVHQLVNDSTAYFTDNGFAFPMDSMTLWYPLYFDTLHVPLLEKVFALDSTSVRYIADSLSVELIKSTRRAEFAFTRDTTVTVTLIDSFEVDMKYNTEQVCSLFYFKDARPDSDPQKVILDSVHSWPTHISLTKSFKRGVAKTFVFFDSVGATWRLAKFTPTVIYFPSPDSAPSINDVKFTVYNSTRVDTFNYQTTNNKLKAMNILRPTDSILTFKSGDSVKVFVHTYYDGRGADNGYYIFYAHFGNIHDHLTEDRGNSGTIQYNGVFEVKFDSPGYKRLYLQMIDTRSFYVSNQQNTKKDFYSTIWVIPIRVQ